MDERGLVVSPSFPDPALIDLGLEALWDFAVWSSRGACCPPDMRTSPSTVTGVGILKQSGATGAFNTN